MSKQVDERVVQMRFDNKQFEANCHESMSTLDKLKEKLRFKDASKGFDELDKSSSKVSFSGLTKGIDAVQTKFSYMQMTIQHQINNLVDTAVNAGKRIVASLTTEPVKAGFGEYELKMGSIKTIMASTGASLEEVNGYLEELNKYSDQTIYSFSDMTSNIGKFTNAGVKLKDAVAAIKGVSNVAAISGANANEASRAMYNFSQALSAGYVKLIDWKSIENANMATVEFKNQLIATAVATGTVTKTADGMYKTLKGHVFDATHNFNDVLQDQWMTTEVLVGTLNKYTDETTEIGKAAMKAATQVDTFSKLMDTLNEAAGSGWAQTWETVIGNREEAIKLFTGINDVVGGFIGRMSDARNELLEGWKDLGGRTVLLNGLKNIFTSLSSIFGSVGKAFREIFPKKTAEQLYKMTVTFEQFTKQLIPSAKTLENIKSTFKGLFAVFDILRYVLSTIAGVLFPRLTKAAGGVGGGFFAITARIGEFITKIRDAITGSNKLGEVILAIVGVFETAFTIIKKLITGVVSIIKGNFSAPGFDSFYKILDKIKSLAEKVGLALGKLVDKVIAFFSGVDAAAAKSKIVGFFKTVWHYIVIVANAIKNVLGKAFANFKENIKNLTFEDIWKGFKAVLKGGILVKIYKFIKNLTDTTGGIKDILKSVNNIFGNLGDCLKAFQNKTNAEALLKIAIAVTVLAGSIMLLTFIDQKKLVDALVVVGLLFAELMASLAILNKMAKGGAIKVSSNFLVIGLAVSILSSALVKLCKIKPDTLKQGIMALTILLSEVTAMAVILSSKEKSYSKSVKGILTLSVALLLLTFVCKKFGKMDSGEMKQGLIAIGALMLGLTVILKNCNIQSSALKTVLAFASLAGTISKFANVAKDLGSLDPDVCKRGILGVAALLLMLTLFVKVAAGGEQSLKKISGIIVLTASIMALSVAIKYLGQMNEKELQNGLLAVGVLVAGMMLVIAALSAISMSGKAALSAVALMMAITASVLVLSLSFNTFKLLDWGTIVKGLVILAGTLAIFGAAAFLLKPVIPVVIGLCGALALLGAGVLMVGIGINAIAVGLIALGAAMTAFAATGTVAMAGFMTMLGEFVLGLIAIVGGALIALCGVIVAAIPAITNVILAVLTAIITVAGTLIPKIAELLLKLITNILALLLQYGPTIAETVVNILLTLLDVIASKIPNFIEAGFNIIIKFLNGMADALDNNAQILWDAMWRLAKSLINALWSGIKTAFKEITNIGKMIIDGLKEGILSGWKKLKGWFSDLLNKLPEWAKNILGIHSPSKVFAEIGRYSDEGLIVGLNKYAGKVQDAAEGVGNSAVNGIQNGILGANNFLDDAIIGDPTIRPILDLSDVEAGARNINSMFSNRQAVAVAAEGVIGVNGYGSGSLSPVNISVYGAPGQDINQLADIVSEKINNSIRRREMAWR